MGRRSRSRGRFTARINRVFAERRRRTAGKGDAIQGDVDHLGRCRGILDFDLEDPRRGVPGPLAGGGIVAGNSVGERRAAERHGRGSLIEVKLQCISVRHVEFVGFFNREPD